MSKKRGFIGIIVLAIVALALLKYFFNFDVFEASKTSLGQSTVGYVKSIIDIVWHYIATPVSFIWSRVVWPVLSLAWNNFHTLIEMGQKSGTTLPQVPML